MTHYAVVHDRGIPFSSSALQPGEAAAAKLSSWSAHPLPLPVGDPGPTSAVSAVGTLPTTDAPSALLQCLTPANRPQPTLPGQLPHYFAGRAAGSEASCEGTLDACQSQMQGGACKEPNAGQVPAQGQTHVAQASRSGPGGMSTAGAHGADLRGEPQLSVMAVPLHKDDAPAQQGSDAAPAGISTYGQGSSPACIAAAVLGGGLNDGSEADQRPHRGQPAVSCEPAPLAGQSVPSEASADGNAALAHLTARQPVGKHAAEAGSQPQAVDVGAPGQHTSAGHALHITTPLLAPAAAQSAATANSSLPASLQEAHKNQPALPSIQQSPVIPAALSQSVAGPCSSDVQQARENAAGTLETALVGLAQEHRLAEGASSRGAAQHEEREEGGQPSTAADGSQGLGGGPSARQLLALAQEVARLEQELEQALIAARQGSREAAAARLDMEQRREGEADARTKLAAVQEAHTNARLQAETAQAQLQELRRAHADLEKRAGLSLQQAHAAEGSKAAARLGKAERAIEAERATVRQLQAALEAVRARPVEQPGNSAKDVGQLSVALAAAQRERAEAAAEMQALHAANNGLQIRVRELLRGEDLAQQARQACALLAAERDESRTLAADAQRALAESELRRRQSDSAVAELREQLRVSESTGGRLLAANSELVDKVNAQAGQLAALQAGSGQARACAPAVAPPQNPAGGTRMSEAELELLALAEYVQELEAALARERALPKTALSLSASQPGAVMGTPPVPCIAEKGSTPAATASTAADGHVVGRANVGVIGGVDALAKEPGVTPVEREQQETRAGKRGLARSVPAKEQSRKWIGLWGYITGADKVVTG